MASPVALTTATIVEPLIVHVDGWPNRTHKLAARIGGEPIETGALITDHAVYEADQLDLDGIVGNLDGWLRPALAFGELRRLMGAAQPVRVVTEWAAYDEMLIEAVTARPEGRGMRLRVRLREIQRALPPPRLSPLPSAALNRLAALGAVGGGIFAQLGSIPTDVLERVQAHNAQRHRLTQDAAAAELEAAAYEQQRLAAQERRRLSDLYRADEHDLDATSTVVTATSVRRDDEETLDEVNVVVATYAQFDTATGRPIFTNADANDYDNRVAERTNLKPWQVRLARWFAAQDNLHLGEPLTDSEARQVVSYMVQNGIRLTATGFRSNIRNITRYHPGGDEVPRGRTTLNVPDDK